MNFKFKPLKKNPGIYVYENKSGQKQYRVRIRYMRNGRKAEHSKQGFNTLAQAKTYIEQMTPRLKSGNINSVINQKRTVGEHWKAYKEMKVSSKNWNIGTAQTNTFRMRKILERFEHTPLKELTRNDVQNFINDLYKDNPDYSQETVKSYLRIIWQLIDDAVEEDYLDKNRFKKVSWEKEGFWKPKKKVLDFEDYQEFMSLAKQYMRKDIYCCFYLVTFGLRRSEAYGIRQSAIHFLDNGLTRIDINWARTKEYPDGKDVKSRDSNRFIIVDEKATEMLHQQINHARKIKAKHKQTLHNEDYIFLAAKSGNPYHIKTLNDHMDKIAKRMSKEIVVSPHMFRHMFATHASANGVDGLQLRKFLGHADVDMTNHYTHGSMEGAEKVMRLTEKYRF